MFLVGLVEVDEGSLEELCLIEEVELVGDDLIVKRGEVLLIEKVEVFLFGLDVVENVEFFNFFLEGLVIDLKVA